MDPLHARGDLPPRAPGSEPEPISDRSHVLYVMVAIVAVFLILWLRPLASSLWLDELGTWWTVDGSFAQALDRALEFQGQSRGYNAVAWLTAQVAGQNEALLRVPSFVASVGSLLLLHRLVARLVDREAALFAALGYVGIEGVAFAATEFRPYAIALFFLVASMLMLVRWLDDARPADAALYVVASAAVIWSHYLFGIALAAQVVYVAVRVKAGSTPVRARSLGIVWGALLVLLLPLGGQLATLWGRRDALSIPYEGSVDEFLVATLRLSFVGALVLGGALGWMLGRFSIDRVPGRPGAASLLWSWLLLPVVVLFAISVLTTLDFYSPRYYLSAAPAGAALFGWAVRSISSVQARRVVAVTYGILAVLAASSPLKADQDWRGLAEAERMVADPDTLVLVHPAFIESTQREWLADPDRRSYLLAPSAFYDMEGRLEPLPFFADEDGFAYLDDLLARQLDGAERIVLVSYPWFGRLGYRAWLEGRLGTDGWRSRLVGSFGSIELVEFTRSEDARSP